MNSLEDGLLQWSRKQQLWKQDLLRHIALGDYLSNNDIKVYATAAENLELKKKSPWITQPELVETRDFVKLDDTNLTATVHGGAPVRITKLTHIHGANDLAKGATLDFIPSGLTIIAGNNGSGKSGYTRILKQVAASRAAGNVLPNVFGSNVSPKAVIRYIVGDKKAKDLTWKSGTPRDKSELQRVRVFDTQAAAVQLAGATEIAYIPPALQILAEFTNALQRIEKCIADDIQILVLQEKRWPDLEVGAGAEILQRLGSSKTKTALLHMQPLTESEENELNSIPSQIHELATSDPAKLAAQAHQRAGQLTTLIRNLQTLSTGISKDAITRSQNLKKNLDAARKSVDEASQLIKAPTAISPTTGNDLWKNMWNSAKTFVEADRKHSFPDASDDAVCPLCQQQLSDIARKRFSQFATFMNGEAQSAFELANNLREKDVFRLQKLPFDAIQEDGIVELVNSYDETISPILQAIITDATSIKNDLVNQGNTYPEKYNIPTLETHFKEVIKVLNDAVKAENEKATHLASISTSAEAQIKLQERSGELKVRKGIAEACTDISAQHDLVIKIAALRAAERSCNTASASKKNSELSANYVRKVCSRFEQEAKQLGISRVPVQLVFDRSSHGVSYIKVQLKNAINNVAINSVLSEGEQRITAIAGFFADLAESGDSSTLVFDDPVSSLDQEYRVKVARRLLQEAENRQVLVFTHDYSFVQYLYEEKKLRDINARSEGKQPAEDIQYIHICRSAEGTGTFTTAEAWRQVSVKERLGRVKQRIQDSRSVYRSNNLVEYENLARDIIGSIRDTWELFVEQEFLNGVVTRHDRSVQTQRLSKLTDIQASDIACINLGMSIESRFMTGHTAPISDGSAPLDPDELLNEEKRLEVFRKKVLDRRKGGGKHA